MSHNRKNNLSGKIEIILLVLIVTCLFAQVNVAQAKTSTRSLKVGSRLRISKSTSNTSYKSSNTTIACVDSQGIVTGKKSGEASIYIKRSGKKTKKVTVKVVKSQRKPASLPVTFSEVSCEEKDGNIYVKNNSKKGKIKKITYLYSREIRTAANNVASGSAVDVHPAEQTRIYTMTVTAKNIAAGKEVKAVRKGNEFHFNGTLSSLKPTQVEMYTGSALYIYEPGKNKYTFQWGSKDKSAPKISGLVKSKSYTGNGDVYRTYYSDKRSSYDLGRFVSAVDDRDGKVKVKVDTSKINWSKQGIYKIYYRATDKAGNTATSWAKVQILTPKSAESAADQILRSITRSGWSDTKKAKAIYNYVRGHCSYVQNSSHSHWRDAGLRGLRYQSGDCYTYYAMCRLLLTRAGIPNVMVKRYPVPNGMRHFWNLAYVQGGWYHFDTTPRQRDRKAKFCLWTDAQMWNFSSGYTFRFNTKFYPKRATRKL